MRSKYLPYVLLLPLFTMIVTIVFIPLANTIFYSFQSYQLTRPDQRTFVGLENYISLFQQDRFLSSLGTSAVYIVGSILGMLILALVTAQIANQSFRGRSIFRASTLIPWAIAPVVAAQTWSFMFQTDLGIVNHLMVSLGLSDQGFPWLVSNNLAMLSVIVTNVWKTTPLLTLIILGGLQTIPNDLYESADIDGGNRMQKYFHITFPLIRPFIFTGLIFTTLQTINVIDIVYTMTGGGPGISTEIFTLLNYNTFFQNLNFGMGGAMAVVGVIVIGILISFYVKGMNKNFN